MSGKQRNLRKKRALDEDEDDTTAAAAAAGAAAGAAAAAAGEGDGPSSSSGAQQQQQQQEVRADLLADLKLLQKQRRRLPGVDASRLVPAAAAAADDDDAQQDNELMDSTYVKAVETNKSQILDESEHMQRYVEAELARRLGKTVAERAAALSKAEQQERELYKMPEGFETSLTKEVNLPGMMTAITEVEVSKEAKIRKIEETERIKAAALAKQSGRKEDGGGDGGMMKVSRKEFAFSFGKAPKKLDNFDPSAANVQEARRYITDRTVDPVYAAKRAAARQRAAGGGGGGGGGGGSSRQ